MNAMQMPSVVEVEATSRRASEMRSVNSMLAKHELDAMLRKPDRET